MSLIEPIPVHEASCACSICVAERKVMVRSSHPLLDKPIEAKKILLPVDQAIAQIQEARDCYQQRINQLDAELKILRDE